MRSMIVATAFLMGLSSSAFAGGNPEDYTGPLSGDAALEATGTGRAAPSDEALQRQYEIQRAIEAEVLAKPQIPAKPLRAEPQPEPVIMAHAEPESGCVAVFDWLADALGGECVPPTYANPGSDGSNDDQRVATVHKHVDKTKDRFKRSWKGYKKAVQRARELHKQGYDVRFNKTRHSIIVKGKKVTYTTTYSLVKIGDGGSDHGRGFRSEDSNFGDGRNNGRGDTPN